MRGQDKSRDLLERAIILINKITVIAKTPIDPGTGEILYPSEMHIIQEIGRHDGINVTELANRLEISKPAVSKFVKKLEKKNLIQRFKETGNDRKVFFRLLPRGRHVLDWHEDYHSRVDAETIQVLKGMNPEELRVAEKFLEMIDSYVEKLQAEKKHGPSAT